MKILPTEILTQITQRHYAPLLLMEIDDWVPDTTIRWNPSDAAFPYNNNVYLRRDFTLSNPKVSQDTSTPTLSLTVSNAQYELSRLTAAKDPAGCRVRFLLVFRDAPTAHHVVIDGLKIDSFDPGLAAYRFLLYAGNTSTRKKTPARICGRTCPWTYRDDDCTYQGPDPDGLPCDNSIAACKRRGNLNEFGGIPPSIPMRA